MTTINTNPSVPSVSIIDNQAKTTSLAVAEFFGKRHDDVLKKIRLLMADLSAVERVRNFAETFQTIAMPNNATKQTPVIEMTKDGFTLLVMGFTGKKALEFKIAYINRFNEMEVALKNPALALTNGQHFVVAKDGIVIYHKVLSSHFSETYLPYQPKDKFVTLQNDLEYFLAPENPSLEMGYHQAQDALTCLSTVINVLERNGLQLGLMYQQTGFVKNLLSSYWTRLDEMSFHLGRIKHIASVQLHPSIATVQGVKFS